MAVRYAIVSFSFLALLSFSASAQKKADKKALSQIKADIEYLASDELEGRRTASAGEQKAADYIISRYKKEGIMPYKNDFKHPFPFVYGKEMAASTNISVASENMSLRDQAFPLPFSANTKQKLHSDVLPDVLEQGNVWLVALYKDQDEASDAHFDWEKTMYDRAKDAKKQGATAVVFYDGYNAKYPPTFLRMSETEMLDIPVAYISYPVYEKYIRNRTEGVDIDLNINIKKSEFTGTNVVAYIDNKAPNTVIIGAHYDHLGYGEDGNSTYTGKDKAIHNGADDNASGTAGLLQLASWIKAKKLKNYNYMFVHFSGEELGLLGSKAFVKELGRDTSNIAYMINMDMIGRLNDSTHALTLGGIGTSPEWGTFTASTKTQKYFRFAIDSSGVGPSDHTSFYHAGIPVLFLFTGIHHDYHKPADDADKINYPGEVEVLKYAYNIVETMEKKPRPQFTPTKQSAVGKVRFKVTLGIMPDYSFNDGGVRVDGVTDERPAAKAGIKAGDIITQMAEYKVNGMQSYMEALSKLKTGDTIDVTVQRDGKPVTMKVTL